MRYRVAISDPEVIAGVRCPLCKAKKGSPCIHMNSKALYRAGQPTKRPHQERRDSAYRMRRQKYLQAPAVQAVRVRTDVVASLYEFDRREAMQLRAWLVAYGDILVNANVAPRLIVTNKLSCSHEVDADELLEPGTLQFCPVHGYVRVLAGPNKK
jgi:hypothetical protein